MLSLRLGVYRLPFVALGVLAGSLAIAQSTTPPVTLDQAISSALARSPRLSARRAAVAEAEGRLLEARTIPFNPEIDLEAGHRTSPTGSATDKSVALTQEIEIGGQRRLRTNEKSAELDSARRQYSREEQLLIADVKGAFALALQARELLAIERSNTELSRSLADVARKRFDAGAAAQMEVNLALTQVGRAERQLHLAEGSYVVARTILAETIALDPKQPPEPAGALDLPPETSLIGGGRLSTALEQRPDLQAFRRTIEAARVRIDRVRSERVPNLKAMGFYSTEEGTDRIVGGAIGIGIPIFNRRQGQLAEARASHDRAAAETSELEFQVRREVSATAARYNAAVEASKSLQAQVMGTLPENLNLLQRSFEAGKISWTEVLVFRREFVDVQREYVGTVTDVQLAAVELELATGATLTPPATEVK